MCIYINIYMYVYVYIHRYMYVCVGVDPFVNEGVAPRVHGN